MERYDNPSRGIRIRSLRGDRSQQEYAKIIGVSQSTLSKYEKGMKPPYDILKRIARDGGTTPEWIESNESPPAPVKIGDQLLVPLYNVEASAGPGEIPIDESVREYLPFKLSWLKVEFHIDPSSLLVVPVSGDSMLPTLADKDAVLVTRTGEIRDDAIYVFRCGDAIHVKRLQTLPGGRWRVISDNKEKYSPYIVDPAKYPEYAIIGRAIWRIGSL